MAIQVNIQNLNNFDNACSVSGTLTVTGSYTTGGDSVNFAAAIAAVGATLSTAAIPSSGPAFAFDAWSAGGNLTNGYFALPGAGLVGKLKISASIGGSELSAGAYPASVTGDVIAFNCTFYKFQ